jgi:hypothetical protein
MKRRWALIVLSIVALASLGRWHRPELPDESWTKERMAREMENLGFRSRWVTARNHPDSWTQGLYLVRNDDPRVWEEIVSCRPRKSAEELWRGLVVINWKCLPYSLESRPEELGIGPFTFYGDPDEIARIAAYFQ